MRRPEDINGSVHFLLGGGACHKAAEVLCERRVSWRRCKAVSLNGVGGNFSATRAARPCHSVALLETISLGAVLRGHAVEWFYERQFFLGGRAARLRCKVARWEAILLGGCAARPCCGVAL